MSPVAATGQLQVQICFSATPPHYLINGDGRAHRPIRINGPSTPWVRLNHWGSLSIHGIPAQGCIGYTSTKFPTQHGHQTGFQGRNFRIVNTHDWLWRPPSIGPENVVRVQFVLPDQGRAAGPWLPLLAAKNVYQISNTPAEWDSYSLIGAVDLYYVMTPGGTRLRLAFAGVAKTEYPKLRRWLLITATNIEATFGHFPIDDLLIGVVGVGPNQEAVPWGEVTRGGRPAVWFFVDASHPLAEFTRDWTATHEMSHLMLPHIDAGDRWISEGLASYYQNVARAQNGQLAAVEAWKALKAGFERGARHASGQTLSNSRNRMLTYWGGAAFFLKADITIRQQSMGNQSLASVLARFARHCLPNERSWSPERYFHQLDRLLEHPVFTPLYTALRTHPGFPSIRSELQRLGINPNTRWQAIRPRDITKLAQTIMGTGPS